MSWLTIPPLYKIGGDVNLNWVYVSVLDIILFLLLLVKILKEGLIVKKYLKILSVFFIFIIISISWSSSPINSLRYLNKYLLIVLIALNFSNSNLSDYEIHKKLTSALIFFLVINWLAEFTIENYLWKYNDTEFFNGIGGRHAIKYYVVFGIIFSLLSYYYLREKKYLILGLLLILTLFGIFQRGAFLGLIIGLSVSFYNILKGKVKYRFAFLLFTFTLLSLLFYILLFTNKGIEYTFYSYEYRDKFLFTLLSEPLNAYNYINFKGRLEYWEFLFSKTNFIYGLGFGSSGRIIEENFGFYNEVHNDWLQILVETGIIGISLYFLFWYNVIKYLKVIIKKQLNVYQKIFSFTTLSYSFYVIINGFVDHVIDYQSTSICLGILLSIVSKYDYFYK